MSRARCLSGLWRLTGLASAGFLAACAVPPDGTSEDDIMFWEDAVASIGCDLVTERQYRVVEFQAGLSREQAVDITRYALEQDRAKNLEGGGIRLVEGPCAPGTETRVIQIEGTG